ncbi:hypothetical protein N7478_009525 [Penicillium angulare]|uniref:uncharacterized protein n=1 Tax=Penicillium angulare TaxID=116970 RepID=UPI00253FA6CB|nr:uncharacterized protein N7478_009525 [Penicillium angulare]KAJ5266717.1 hypothetical protein N7478_009525 [Penicillium angulare]
MSSHDGYLPTEVVMEIANWVNGTAMRWSRRQRQSVLYNFCLVNRQWYSVGIEKLYQSPILWTGNSFEKFTRTICPSSKEKKSGMKMDLGSLIHNLDLKKLVHQSSNSKTSRLLKKASPNLTTFEAPRVSFSLPTRMTITRTLPTSDPWPPSLGSLAIGGHLDASVMQTFSWPPKLRCLIISQCSNLSDRLLRSILSNEILQANVSMLSISSNCRFGTYEDEDLDSSAGLFEFDCLTDLDIPADLADYFLLLGAGFPPPGELKSVCFGDRVSDFLNTSNFRDDLLKSLNDGALSGLWLLKIAPKFFETLKISEEELDEIVMCNLDDVSDEELDEWNDDMGFMIGHPYLDLE